MDLRDIGTRRRGAAAAAEEPSLLPPPLPTLELLLATPRLLLPLLPLLADDGLDDGGGGGGGFACAPAPARVCRRGLTGMVDGGPRATEYGMVFYDATVRVLIMRMARPLREDLLYLDSTCMSYYQDAPNGLTAVRKVPAEGIVRLTIRFSEKNQRDNKQEEGHSLALIG